MPGGNADIRAAKNAAGNMSAIGLPSVTPYSTGALPGAYNPMSTMRLNKYASPNYMQSSPFQQYSDIG